MSDFEIDHSLKLMTEEIALPNEENVFYRGQVNAKGQPHGFGRMVDKDEDLIVFYDGEFKDGEVQM